MKIIALPQELCIPYLHESARFCLDVAKSQGAEPDEIWILGARAPKAEVFAPWFDVAIVKSQSLDQKTWPLDVGNNRLLRLPLILYEAIKAAPGKITQIYAPLNRASAYFAQMAKRGGLLPDALSIELTAYLPRALELSGGLILPLELSDVIESEMESAAASMADTVWISHEAIRDGLLNRLELTSLETIRTIPKPAAPHQRKPAGKHIVFCGQANPLYGMDAFCDLAEGLAGSLEQVTVILPRGAGQTKWSKAIKVRLSALPARLSWQETDNIDTALVALDDGVLIAPMRAAVYPEAVRRAEALGMHVIWSSGFDLGASAPSKSVQHTPADARRLKAALLALWNPESVEGRMAAAPWPPRSHAVSKDKAQKPNTKALPPVQTLSVIVTHHNRLDMLGQALDSLAAQTLKDFEVIIVDDGSTQCSASDIEALLTGYKFSASQICLIENSYPAVARNHGASVASGDALFFLDDDNALRPDALSRFMGALQGNELVLSFYQTFQGAEAPSYSADEQPASQPCYGFAGLLPGAGLFYNILGNSSLMTRRSTFKDWGGFSAKYGIGLEDYAFLLSAALRGEISCAVLPEPYLYFRLHDQKIRNSHVDWKSAMRLQAGHWRLYEDISLSRGVLPITAMAYARQLHEVTQYQYVHSPRPKYFRLRSVLLHQYLRPLLSRSKLLRRAVTKFTSGESRLAKRLERLFF